MEATPEIFELSGNVPAVPRSERSATTEGHEAPTVHLSNNSKIDISEAEFMEMRANITDTPPPDSIPQELNELAPDSTRAELIRKISHYRTVFKNETRDLDYTGLGEKDVYELGQLLHETEYMISTRKSLASSRGMFVMGCAGVEQVSEVLGMFKLSGFTHKVVTNRKF